MNPQFASKSHTNIKHFTIATLLTACTAVGLFAVLRIVEPSWDEWRQATCMPFSCFCELPRMSLVRQPSNAVTSLAFTLVAAIVLFLPGLPSDDPVEGFRSKRVYTYLFSLATAIIGIGSAFYHASLTFIGQTIDVLGMYLLATFLVLYGIGRIFKISDRGAALLYIGANGLLLWALIVAPALRRYLFAALIVAVLVLETVIRRRNGKKLDGRHFRTAVILLLVGFLIWIGDITRVFCLQESWIQGHAIWHVLGAASAFQIYRYYLSGLPANTT